MIKKCFGQRDKFFMKTIIYGNGAIARLVFSFIKGTRDVGGFLVDDSCIPPGVSKLCGLQLIPLSMAEQTFAPDTYEVIVAVGFLSMNSLREQKSKQLQSMGYQIGSYIHESVLIHDDVTIDQGSIILDHVSIHPGSHIGKGTFVSSNVNIGHDCKVGKYGWINSGVSVAGGCDIGEQCFFGVNASTANDISLGKKNFVGAGTFVGKNTDDDAVFISEQGQQFPMSSQAFLRFSGLEG